MTSLKKAKEILGKNNVFGPEDWIFHFPGVSFTEAQLAQIAQVPWSTNVLSRPGLQLPHFLFLGIEKMDTTPFSLAFLSMIFRGPSHPQVCIMSSTPLQEGYAHNICKLRWYLMPFDITGMPTIFNDRQNVPNEYEVSNATERVTANILYYALNKKYLDTWYKVRTCDLDNRGNPVWVEGPSGAGILASPYGGQNSGVAISRKIPPKEQTLTENDINIVEPQMVRIPAGKFLMGSTKKQVEQAIKDSLDKDSVVNEQPQHEVELSEYFIGKYPVTNREYQAFIRDAKYDPPEDWDNDQYPAEKGDHPVVYVSWDDAQEYCKWLSQKTSKQYRLPSEAEWEKAARGTDGRVYPWGDDFDPKKCNGKDSGIGGTTPVGQFSQAGGDSPYGCSDMAGNVWEFCNDWRDDDEYKKRLGLFRKKVKDPLGPEIGKYKVLRGGSWQTTNRVHVRVSRRGATLPHGRDSGSGGKGFRLVLCLPS